MARIVMFGKSGQVGSALARQTEVVAIDRSQVDLADPGAIRRAILEHRPACVINAAAYTAVDRAESEPELAQRINALAPEAMAQAAREIGARFVHFSTDYVFDGTGTQPYREDDLTGPSNVYGRTKLEGERRVIDAHPESLIFRLAWVYANEGRNFLNTMVRLAKSGAPIRVVDDQVGSPTWAVAIARATLDVLSHPRQVAGIFHMTPPGQTTWYGFAEEIFRHAGRDVDRRPIATEDFPTPAARPAYSLLDSSKLYEVYGVRMADWRTQLAECWNDRPEADR